MLLILFNPSVFNPFSFSLNRKLRHFQRHLDFAYSTLGSIESYVDLSSRTLDLLNPAARRKASSPDSKKDSVLFLFMAKVFYMDKWSGMVHARTEGRSQVAEPGIAQGLRQDLRQDLRQGLRQDLRHGLRQDLRQDLRPDLRHDLRHSLHHDLRQDLRPDLRQDLRHGLRQDLRHDLCQGLHQDLRHSLRHDLRQDLRQTRPVSRPVARPEACPEARPVARQRARPEARPEAIPEVGQERRRRQVAPPHVAKWESMEPERWQECLKAAEQRRCVQVSAVHVAARAESLDHYGLRQHLAERPEEAPRRRVNSVPSIARPDRHSPDPANYTDAWTRPVRRR